MSQVTSGLTSVDTDSPLVIPSQAAVQPIHDIDAFLAALPRVEPEAVQALDQAIAENRAQRREAVHE